LILGIILSHEVKRIEPPAKINHALLFEYHSKIAELLRPKIKALQERPYGKSDLPGLEQKCFSLVREIAKILEENGCEPSIFNDSDLTKIADQMNEMMTTEWELKG
jgi:hypothetical protein